jgi:copper chaperone CopZ
MTCGDSISNLTHALKAIAGFGNVRASLSVGTAAMQYDEPLTSSDQLKSAVKGAGWRVNVTNAALGHQTKGGCCG